MIIIKNFFAVEEGGEHRKLLVIGDGRDGGEGATGNFEAAAIDLSSCLEVLAAPSPFGATAIARSIVLRLLVFKFLLEFILLTDR